MLAEEDVEAIGAALEPGSYVAVLAWENVWLAPFAAVRHSGGQVVVSGRIPIQALAAALEADQEATAEGA